MTGETGFTGDGEQPSAVEAAGMPVPFGVAEPAPRHPSPLVRRLGLTALVFAVVGVAAEVVGILIGNAGEWQGATILAWFSIVVTAVGFLGGLVAAIANRDRRLGVIALVIGLIGNPLVLVGLLGALS
jgi:hypothetical protein